MKVTINMTKARDIHRAKLRQAREPKLVELDTTFQRELEKGAQANTAAIVAAKQALRDLPSDPKINQAKSATALKALWPTDLLGPSPYTGS
jgi:hypothetical protein